MKKILGILIFTMVLLNIPILTESSIINDDVTINIYAGYFKNNIGYGITIDFRNNKSEDVTIFYNISFDFLFINHWDYIYSWNGTLEPKSILKIRIRHRIIGIKYISIIAQAGNTTKSRTGIAINNIIILT